MKKDSLISLLVTGVTKIQIIVVITSIFLFIPLITYGQQFTDVEKKIDKTIWKHFDEEEIEKININISVFKYEKIKNTDIKGKIFFKLFKDTIYKGILCLSTAKGKIEPFRYMIIYSPELVIKTIKILDVVDPEANVVASKRWLKQFTNSKPNKYFIYKRDISTITGATISTQNIINNINEIGDILYELQEKKIL